MLPELVTTNIIIDRGGRLILGVEIAHKRWLKRDRGIGALNLGVEIIHKLIVEERPQLCKNT